MRPNTSTTSTWRSFARRCCACCPPRGWSLDALIRPRRDRTVPRAAIAILRAQTGIMLVYAGQVKLTPDWLRGEPLGLWLRERTEGTWIAPLFQQDWLIVLACWAVIALHVLGAPLLLQRRTRLPVFLLYCAFHGANAFFFNTGIFPWMTTAASTIFLAPDWPSRLAARLSGRPRPAPSAASAAHRLSPLAMLAMTLWIAVQLALPIRGALFKSETRWSGDGHRFSWRMQIYEREAVGAFVVTDRTSGDSWRVDPDSFLTPRQTDKMIVRSDLILQFAHHLADIWTETGREVSVHAEICKSLNGRPCQIFIDPEVDLSGVQRNLLAADPWVLPLETPHWGVADNRWPKVIAAVGDGVMARGPD